MDNFKKWLKAALVRAIKTICQTANRLLVANTPQGQQAFRITSIEPTKNKIKAKCWHVFMWKRTA